jgi:hypothetical protein
MRQDEAFFGDQDLALMYIAKRLREAKRLEEVLTASNLDYLVETDTYRGGIIFVSERVGAFFYVHPDHEETCRNVMIKNSFTPYMEAPSEK